MCHDRTGNGSTTIDGTKLMEQRPVGPYARAAALVIDELIRWTLIVVVLCSIAGFGVASIGATLLTIVLVYCLYGVTFEVLAAGQTPGKKSQRIAVVNDDGTPVRLYASIIRNLLLLLDALPFAYMLGLVAMFVTRRFQRIGDLAAGTLVVYRQPHEAWAAADLGCIAVRREPATFYLAWFATAAPVFVLIAIGMSSSPATAGFLLWWFKPVYERMPTWIASERSAGRSATLGDAFANWRMLATGLLPVLTYRRLSPTRSLDASIDVLEALRGPKRRAHVALFRQRSGSAALWLTVICVHVEAFLATGAFIVQLLLTPDLAQFDPAALLAALSDDRFAWLQNGIYLIAIGLVGPVYAASGYALYANRRNELERRSAPA
jgi:uncharacterized RDD family membrane protein YckC